MRIIFCEDFLKDSQVWAAATDPAVSKDGASDFIEGYRAEDS
jgi:hypothetical protein